MMNGARPQASGPENLEQLLASSPSWFSAAAAARLGPQALDLVAPAGRTLVESVLRQEECLGCLEVQRLYSAGHGLMMLRNTLLGRQLDDTHPPQVLEGALVCVDIPHIEQPKAQGSRPQLRQIVAALNIEDGPQGAVLLLDDNTRIHLGQVREGPIAEQQLPEIVQASGLPVIRKQEVLATAISLTVHMVAREDFAELRRLVDAAMQSVVAAGVHSNAEAVGRIWADLEARATDLLAGMQAGIAYSINECVAFLPNLLLPLPPAPVPAPTASAAATTPAASSVASGGHGAAGEQAAISLAEQVHSVGAHHPLDAEGGPALQHRVAGHDNTASSPPGLYQQQQQERRADSSASFNVWQQQPQHQQLLQMQQHILGQPAILAPGAVAAAGATGNSMSPSHARGAASGAHGIAALEAALRKIQQPAAVPLSPDRAQQQQAQAFRPLLPQQQQQHFDPFGTSPLPHSQQQQATQQQWATQQQQQHQTLAHPAIAPAELGASLQAVDPSILQGVLSIMQGAHPTAGQPPSPHLASLPSPAGSGPGAALQLLPAAPPGSNLPTQWPGATAAAPPANGGATLQPTTNLMQALRDSQQALRALFPGVAAAQWPAACTPSAASGEPPAGGAPPPASVPAQAAPAQPPPAPTFAAQPAAHDAASEQHAPAPVRTDPSLSVGTNTLLNGAGAPGIAMAGPSQGPGPASGSDAPGTAAGMAGQQEQPQPALGQPHDTAVAAAAARPAQPADTRPGRRSPVRWPGAPAPRDANHDAAGARREERPGDRRGADGGRSGGARPASPAADRANGSRRRSRSHTRSRSRSRAGADARRDGNDARRRGGSPERPRQRERALSRDRDRDREHERSKERREQERVRTKEELSAEGKAVRAYLEELNARLLKRQQRSDWAGAGAGMPLTEAVAEMRDVEMPQKLKRMPRRELAAELGYWPQLFELQRPLGSSSGDDPLVRATAPAGRSAAASGPALPTTRSQRQPPLDGAGATGAGVHARGRSRSPAKQEAKRPRHAEAATASVTMPPQAATAAAGSGFMDLKQRIEMLKARAALQQQAAGATAPGAPAPLAAAGSQRRPSGSGSRPHLSGEQAPGKGSTQQQHPGGGGSSKANGTTTTRGGRGRGGGAANGGVEDAGYGNGGAGSGGGGASFAFGGYDDDSYMTTGHRAFLFEMATHALFPGGDVRSVLLRLAVQELRLAQPTEGWPNVAPGLMVPKHAMLTSALGNLPQVQACVAALGTGEKVAAVLRAAPGGVFKFMEPVRDDGAALTSYVQLQLAKIPADFRRMGAILEAALRRAFGAAQRAGAMDGDDLALLRSLALWLTRRYSPAPFFGLWTATPDAAAAAVPEAAAQRMSGKQLAALTRQYPGVFRKHSENLRLEVENLLTVPKDGREAEQWAMLNMFQRGD